MTVNLEDRLVVAISSQALFDLSEADEVFRTQGTEQYRAYQRAHERVNLAPGTGMPLVKGLLRLNRIAGQDLVEVVVISRNDADTGRRVFHAIAEHGLSITRAAFTAGAEPHPYLAAFSCDLFLSTDLEAVRSALRNGFAAAQVLAPPAGASDEAEGPVVIAFDGDAVLFGDESERVFQAGGVDAFNEHEALHEHELISPGPFRPFLQALARVQAAIGPDNDALRIALVTSRSTTASPRVVNTLRHWNIRIDESFFLGGMEKARILEVLRPHIFFDDQRQHLDPARSHTPSAHVPPEYR